MLNTTNNIYHSNKFKFSTLYTLLWMICLLWSLPAFAEDQCDGIGSNPEWNQKLNIIIQEYTRGDYAAAQKNAKHLSETICSSSPVLLYTQGKICEAQNDHIKALLFFQKASEATYRFAVPPDMAQKIWYARYENEHPDRTESALEAKDKEIEILRNQNAVSKIANGNDIDKAKNWMWTGVGIDIAGLALIGTGAALIFSNIKEPGDIRMNLEDLSKPEYNTKPAYIAGWGMLGAGIAFTVVGTVLTGYFGYQYTHADENLETAFSLTPTGASFSMKF